MLRPGTASAAIQAEVFRRASGLPLAEIAATRLHHGPSGFLNPFSERGHGNMLGVLSWKLFHRNEFKEYYPDEPVTRVEVDWTAVKETQGLSLTFVKHSCVFIKDRERSIIIDPVFGGLFGFFRDFSPLAFAPADVPRPDYVLLTHGHYDHLDLPTLRLFDGRSHFITPLGYDSVFSGFNGLKRTRLDWLETHRDGGLEITLLPCNHWTMRNPLTGPNRSLWGSYLIRTAAGPNIFISGDAAWFDRYGELGRLADIDLAVFNLGAYEPRWFMKDSHMNPAEVVRAFLELKARRLMIVHWGAFRLGDEPVHFPPRDIRLEMEKQGLFDRLIAVEPGGNVVFPRDGGPPTAS